MALPINFNELINGKTVEWERVEFRSGWNPERTLKTICAFANDFNNWGGGYIILGIEEKNGRPLLQSPKGVELNQIDSIQKELNQLCRKIIPSYFPIIEPIDFKGKKVLVFWCPGGSNRPYKCPDSFGKKQQNHYYIRKFSSTVLPTIEEERELITLANQIPFDDQVNHFSQLSDLDLSSIKTFLSKVGSDLEKEIPNLSINELVRKMNIAEGSDEYLLPKNAGLLFFGKETQKTFPSAKIEVVIFNDESGSNYIEKIFTGTLYQQLISALGFLKDLIVKEMVIKSELKAEAERLYNYPFDALEEALCNAVYHRGYDHDSPIEIRINPTQIDIISFPGPLPPLNKEKLKNNQFDVRKYRNRRIGEILKELHLTEGRATGIPTIIKALKNNGSPNAVFETDDDRNYFKSSFKIHSKFIQLISGLNEHGLHKYDENLKISWDQVGTKLGLSQDEVQTILIKCLDTATMKEIMLEFNWNNRTKFKEKFINPLLSLKFLEMTIPDKPKSSLQKYQTTKIGKNLIL